MINCLILNSAILVLKKINCSQQKSARLNIKVLSIDCVQIMLKVLTTFPKVFDTYIRCFLNILFFSMHDTLLTIKSSHEEILSFR